LLSLWSPKYGKSRRKKKLTLRTRFHLPWFTKEGILDVSIWFTWLPCEWTLGRKRYVQKVCLRAHEMIHAQQHTTQFVQVARRPSQIWGFPRLFVKQIVRWHFSHNNWHHTDAHKARLQGSYISRCYQMFARPHVQDLGQLKAGSSFYKPSALIPVRVALGVVLYPAWQDTNSTTNYTTFQAYLDTTVAVNIRARRGILNCANLQGTGRSALHSLKYAYTADLTERRSELKTTVWFPR
jgi:hypothetical protein